MTQMLRTARLEEVLATDAANVARIQKVVPEAGQGGSQEVLKAVHALRDEHDGRAERALRAVHMLREEFHWKARPDFAGEEEEQKLKEQKALVREDNANDEADENEAENQIVVETEEALGNDLPTDGALISMGVGAGEDADDGPLDSDEDLFDEVV